jgi:hypothetical protein
LLLVVEYGSSGIGSHSAAAEENADCSKNRIGIPLIKDNTEILVIYRKKNGFEERGDFLLRLLLQL